MTLILKLDLDIVKMYHHTKNEVSMSIPSKVIARTDRQTDTHTHTHRHYENITSTTYAGGNKIKTFIFGEDSAENPVPSCQTEETIGEAFERNKSNNVNLGTYISVKYPEVNAECWNEIWQHQTADKFRLLKRLEREARKERKFEEKRLMKEKKKEKMCSCSFPKL